MASVEEISFLIRSGEMDPASISIGWTVSKWRYKVRVCSGRFCLYQYWAGNSRHDSAQTVALNKALRIGEMRKYAQSTAEEIAEELGLQPDCVFEEKE